MNIKIKLEDPLLCKGCPLFVPEHWEYEDGDRYLITNYCLLPGVEVLCVEEDLEQRRPQECVDKNGL